MPSWHRPQGEEMWYNMRHGGGSTRVMPDTIMEKVKDESMETRGLEVSICDLKERCFVFAKPDAGAIRGTTESVC